MSNNSVDVKKRKDRLKEIFFETELNKKPRQQQIYASEWIEENIHKNKFFLLEMPTGSGKSYWAMTFCKWYLENIKQDARFDILTNTKILQAQYTSEFNFLNNLSGKANYQCAKCDNTCEYGKELVKNKKQESCEYCPHDDAVSEWLNGKVSITNFHIHSLYSLYLPQKIEARGSDVLIIDEAHLYEEVVNGFVSLNISTNYLKKIFNPTTVESFENDISKLESIDQIASWVSGVLTKKLSSMLYSCKETMKTASGKEYDKISKKIKNIDEFNSKISSFHDDYVQKTSTWIFDKKVKKGDISLDIHPLWTSDILKKVWKNYKYIILMSGTILDASMFSYIYGLETSEVTHLSMPSPFKLSNRPIYYLPSGKLSYKLKEKSWPTVKDNILKILKKYKGKKGIIHTGNYEILEWIQRDIKDSRLLFATPKDREAKLNQHLDSDKDTILVSPSMIHGVDLKNNLSRFQVIVKIPYPSLGSKINKERFNTKPRWYTWKTVNDIIQAYGRSIRNEDDYADTIILDSCFGDIMAHSSDMLPDYFLKAIKKLK